eukprot:m.200526 g.200526  ORF g.200526 m.200526 type:complete len:447 (-) comp13711_c0_seq1:1688-3028(-)
MLVVVEVEKCVVSGWSSPSGNAQFKVDKNGVVSILSSEDSDNEIVLGRATQVVKEGQLGVKFTTAIEEDGKEINTVTATFASPQELKVFVAACSGSDFHNSRDASSVAEYFKYYAHLSQQQNMMQDSVRTSLYRDAILKNFPDFKDKVVLDVGAGSGLLSFFAAQAGARKVYAVEASNMADCARSLVEANNQSDVIEVIKGKLEEIVLPEKVDAIVSEPLGIMLVNERMLESYVHARKWLKDDGKMFPTNSTMFVCPFSDSSLYMETYQRTSFWQTPYFHGIDLTSLHEESMKECFGQPCVEQINPTCLVGQPVAKLFDYLTMDEAEFYEIEIPFSYQFEEPQEIHGFASWFDNDFCGSRETITLSTSPFSPVTHWYQVRLLLQTPVLLQPNEEMKGVLRMTINRIQSYDVVVEVETDKGLTSSTRINLKEPNFRFGYAFNPTQTS